MKERWIVRLLVDRDPDLDSPPGEWDWSVEGADVTTLSAQIVGVTAPVRDATHWTDLK